MDNPIPFHLLVHKFWEVHPILMSCAKFIFCYTKWPFHSENSTIFKRYTSPVNLCGQDMRWSCCRMPELEEGGCTELCDLCGKVWRRFVCLCILFLSWRRKAAPSILIFVERLGWMHIFVCLFVICDLFGKVCFLFFVLIIHMLMIFLWSNILKDNLIRLQVWGALDPCVLIRHPDANLANNLEGYEVGR